MNARSNLIPALLLTSTLAAQEFQRDTLLFTTLQDEQSACMMLPALQAIDPRSIMCVIPDPQVPACAEKFLPDNGLLTLLGDENNNSDIWEPTHPENIDALQWRIGIGNICEFVRDGIESSTEKVLASFLLLGYRHNGGG